MTSPPGKWLVFCLAAVGIFMSTLDSSIVNLGLPVIMGDLSAGMGSAKWVVTIYLLTVSCLLLAFGRLSDIKGRRWVYGRGLLLFTFGSLFCGASPGIAFLVAARIIQAVGAAMIMACTPALVADTFPAHERGKALGMVGAVVASGLTSGPAIGGLILSHFSWRALFLVNVPVGLAAALASFRLLARDLPDRESGRFDWPGALLLAASFVSLLLVVSEPTMKGAGKLWLGLLAASFVFFTALFVYAESRSDHPLVGGDVLRIRLFSFSILSAVCLFASLFFLVFLMPFYLAFPGGFSSGRAGLILVTPFFFLLAFAPITGAASDRIGSRFLTVAGLLILAAALFWLSKLPAGASWHAILIRLALAGIGVATFTSPNSAAALSAVPARRRGIAAAMVATARNMGMVLGVAVAALVFHKSFTALSGGRPVTEYGPALSGAFLTAFSRAMQAGAGVAVIGALVSLFRGAEKPRRASHAEQAASGTKTEV